MTIVILFHQSNDRTVKHFDGYVTNYLGKEFPNLMSTSRFVYLKKNLFGPVFTYLLEKREEITRIAFIDFPSIDVCHNKRIKRNKVFKGLAKKGKQLQDGFSGLNCLSYSRRKEKF
ncbi:transposase [Candidatus Protochlamydia sp. R18]|uniref:transposase n=1 Tax=Candidatus Protochlamydia sp. R18 TaxID=1353977 RepID=UPI000A935756